MRDHVCQCRQLPAIQTPFEASGLTSHAAAGQGNTGLIFGDHLVTEGRRGRSAEVYPTHAGVAGLTPKPFYCSNMKKMHLSHAQVKRWKHNPSLSAQNPLTTLPLHG
jgi:hypothetical protein